MLLMNKFIKRLIIIFIFVTAIVLFMIKSEMFELKEVKVQNLKRIKKDDIIKILWQYNNQNIFMINTKEIKDKLMENPEIENVTIKRELPNKLILNIKEKETIGLIKYMNSYIEIDKNGYVIRVEGYLPRSSVIFEGIDIKEVVVGSRLKISDEFLFSEGLKVAQKLKELDAFRKFKVDYIFLVLTNVNNIKLKIDKLTVELGNSSDLEYKLSLLKAVYDKLPLHVKGKVIISSNGVATFTPSAEEDKK